MSVCNYVLTYMFKLGVCDMNVVCCVSDSDYTPKLCVINVRPAMPNNLNESVQYTQMNVDDKVV